MKLIAYLRVSTDKQADEGTGLDVQLATIKRWAKLHGHKIAHVLKDEGVSGAKELDHRPGLLEAFTLLRARKAVGLVVYRLDRLARDLVIQESLLQEVKRFGAQVLSTSEAEASYLVDDPSDPTRKLIRQVIGAVAEYERSLIVLRLRAGREHKAARGGYAHGAPAYGLTADGGALVVNHNERGVIDRMVAMRREGLSLPKIIESLDAEGLRPKRGGSWHPTTVARILRREGVSTPS